VTEHKRNIESLTLIPTDGGAFEVEKDGRLLFSKLKAERFPDDGEIQAILTGDAEPVLG